MNSLDELTVKDLMRETELKAHPDQRLSEVLGTMKKHRIHEMPVVRKNRLLGMVEMDRLIRSRRVPVTSYVRNVLSSNPTVGPDDDLPTAAKLMISSDLKAIPVAENDEFLGILARSDLIRKMPEIEEFGSIDPVELMTPGPLCVYDDDTVDQARRIMWDLDERSVPVTDKDGTLIGTVDIISVMDVLQKIYAAQRSKNKLVMGDSERSRPRVRDIMSSSVAAIGKKSDIAQIVEIMEQTDSTSIVITEREEPVGIITQWDLLGLMAQAEEKEGVLIQISGLDHEDAGVYDALYWIVQKTLKKIAKQVTPRVLNIHGISHMKEGGVARYTLKCKLITSKTFYIAERDGYDLFQILDECLDVLDRQVTKEQERIRDMHRGKI